MDYLPWSFHAPAGSQTLFYFKLTYVLNYFSEDKFKFLHVWRWLCESCISESFLILNNKYILFYLVSGYIGIVDMKNVVSGIRVGDQRNLIYVAGTWWYIVFYMDFSWNTLMSLLRQTSKEWQSGSGVRRDRMDLVCGCLNKSLPTLT